MAGQGAATGESDILGGGACDDTIDGAGGSDIIKGGGGRDTVCCGNGDTIVPGGAHAGNIRGDTGYDPVEGDAGNDVLPGHEGGGAVKGKSGDDAPVGVPGCDDRFSGEGDDRLAGGSDDPMTVCLRGMGGAALLTREGEVALVKRMKARWRVIPGGLDEPLPVLDGDTPRAGGVGRDGARACHRPAAAAGEPGIPPRCGTRPQAIRHRPDTRLVLW